MGVTHAVGTRRLRMTAFDVSLAQNYCLFEGTSVVPLFALLSNGANNPLVITILLRAFQLIKRINS